VAASGSGTHTTIARWRLVVSMVTASMARMYTGDRYAATMLSGVNALRLRLRLRQNTTPTLTANITLTHAIAKRCSCWTHQAVGAIWYMSATLAENVKSLWRTIFGVDMRLLSVFGLCSMTL